MNEKMKKIIEDNNKVIKAIDEGKNIDVNKSIKACLLSMNRLINIIEKSKKCNCVTGNKNEREALNNLKNIFGFEK